MKKLYPFMKDERYVSIVEKYMNAYNHTLKQHKNQVISKRIEEDAKNAVREMRNDLESFYRTKKKEIETEKSRVKRAYKSQRNAYSNPQEEILKRQDFEMEVTAATDGALSNLLNDTDRTYSNFEIDRLHVEFKNRDMEDEATKMLAVKDHLGYGKEFEKDPNYQLLEQEDEFMLLAEPKGKNTLLYIPTESGNSSFYLDDIESLAINPNKRKVSGSKLVGNQHANDAHLIKDGYETLVSNIQSQNAWASQFDSQRKKDINEHLNYRESKGDPVKAKEYDDTDLRAIRGSNKHDVTVEYKYLRERYHDPNNALYDPLSNDYDIQGHIRFLRGKHEENLKNNPDLAATIQSALSEEVSQEDGQQVE